MILVSRFALVVLECINKTRNALYLLMLHFPFVQLFLFVYFPTIPVYTLRGGAQVHAAEAREFNIVRIVDSWYRPPLENANPKMADVFSRKFSLLHRPLPRKAWRISRFEIQHKWRMI